jgi:hypothetical protein
MKKKKNNPCYFERNTPWTFLWWKGVTHETGYNHEWIYKDDTHRICDNCGVAEILYRATRDEMGYISEDWRRNK